MATPDFISDEHMAKLNPKNSAPDFISDEDMSQLSSPKSSPVSSGVMDSLKQVGKSTLENLPALGGMAGGAAGGVMAGPPGAIVGAGMGGYLGSATKNLINSQISPTQAPTTAAGAVGSALSGGAEQAAQQIAGEGLGDIASKGVGLITDAGSAIKNYATKAASSFGQDISGMPKALTQNYVENLDKINSMIPAIRQSAADFAADMRSKWSDAVQTTKKSLYDTRDAVVRGAPKDNNIEITPILDKLESVKANLNPKSQSDAISQIDRDINLVKSMGQRTSGSVPATGGSYNPNIPETYHTNLQNLHAIKQHLQSVADGSYNQGGQIFTSASGAQNAARGAGAVARNIFIDEAPAAASKAEAQLHALHGVEESMNSNLLDPNGPPNVLTQAGSNPGGAPARTLKELGKIVPYDFLQDAKDFATAQAFANPGMVPMDSTGKSVARQALTKLPAAAIGYLAGLPFGHEYVGSAIGARYVAPYLASPAMMKSGINTMNSMQALPQGLLNAAPAAGRLLAPRIPGLLNKQGGG